jgi:DNA polymerase-3 subunit delta'
LLCDRLASVIPPPPAPRTTFDVWADVVGQDHAVGQLQAAVPSPVHAYLLVGPRGSGKRQLALSFAAALLSYGLDSAAADRAAELALHERHPDLKVVQRSGAYIRKPEAEVIIYEASRSPIEGPRKVLVLDEFHLVEDVGPLLLKTIEEPADGVVFVVLADEVPPELITIASRCVRLDLGPIPDEVIIERLRSEGVAADVAARAAHAATGDLRRARVLATDPGVARRQQWWHDTPSILNGSGNRAVERATELLELIEAAAEPLKARHAEERTALETRIEQYGERGSGRKAMEEQHKRELRRHRTDELRFGLSVLARRYRDAMVASPRAEYGQAVDRIQQMAEGLIRNPNERLQLVALLADLPPLP